MSLTQFIGSPFVFAHTATNTTSADEPTKYPLPKAGRHRPDPDNGLQWRVVVPARPKEQR